MKILLLAILFASCAAPGKCRPSKGSKDFARHYEIRRYVCPDGLVVYDTVHKPGFSLSH